MKSSAQHDLQTEMNNHETNQPLRHQSHAYVVFNNYYYQK